jgi:hypothetical protein
MFLLVNRQISGSKIVAYIIKDDNGKHYAYDTNTFKELVRKKQVLGVTLKNNRLVGKGLHTHATPVLVQSSSAIDVTFGKEAYLDAIAYKTRRSEFFAALSGIDSSDYKVTIISGVRRTGKTILSQQLLEYKEKRGYSVCYMLITKNIDFTVLLNELKREDIRQCDYICIDEITLCDGFVDEAASLSDVFCRKSNARLILTGTDSFAFSLARSSTLFGRATDVNLSLLLYKDYKALFNKGIISYCTVANMLDRLTTSVSAHFLHMTFAANIATSLKKSKTYLYSGVTGVGRYCIRLLCNKCFNVE